MSLWLLWFSAALTLLIVEIFTAVFLAACFAFGCAVAGLAALLGAGYEIQLLSFAAGSCVGVFGIRPLMRRVQKNDLSTNADAMIGKTGRVSEVIDPKQNSGRVEIDGVSWRAQSEDGGMIVQGMEVEILEINSTILIVKRIS